jgi:hypothetical protein
LVGQGGAVFDGVLKRALAKGEVLRVARGLYCLRSDLLAFKLDPHVFAPLICEPSYLSFESARGRTAFSTKRLSKVGLACGFLE